MTSTQFHSQAGRLLGHVVVKTGQFPAVTVSVVFRYESGEATYDGKTWTFLVP